MMISAATTISTALLHWKSEETRLETDGAAVLRAKAKAWLPDRTLPKAPTLLRHKLVDFVQSKISITEGVAVATPAEAIMTEQWPTTSQTDLDPLTTPDMALAADVPLGEGAEGADMLQRGTGTGQELTAQAGAPLELAQENAWLRRQLETALRAMQEAGVQMPQGAAQTAQRPAACKLQCVPAVRSPTRGPGRLAVEAKEVVFFGLPLAPGASSTDASLAVQQFCTAKLLMPDLQSIHITYAGMCRAANGRFDQQRPATVVVARLESQQAAALFTAKRAMLDCTCPVSIDWQRSPEERKRRQAQRLASRQVGQEGRDFEPVVGQQGEGRIRVEGDVATLH
jgi:hypothetical protein